MSRGDAPRIYLSAGEPSGDLHGAGVVRALLRRFPGAAIEATGGAMMAASGAVIRHSISGCGAMGVAEVIHTIPRHFGMLSDLTKRFRGGQYDLVVLVDYPGFHLKLAAAATQAGIPVLYYIAPQLWAWGAGRAGRLRQSTRALAVILPFEEGFFRTLDISAEFVGHPLLDAPAVPARGDARAALGLDNRAPVLALLPGSRPQEVARLWPSFRDAARAVQSRAPATRIVIAGMPGFEYPGREDFVACESSAMALAAADAALCKSGTATLQATLADVPMVIAYRMHPLSHAVARRFVRTRHIGLVNLVAGREVAPELIQAAASPGALAAAVLPLLDRAGKPAGAQRAAFTEVRRRLGTAGAGERVAEIAARLVA